MFVNQQAYSMLLTASMMALLAISQQQAVEAMQFLWTGSQAKQQQQQQQWRKSINAGEQIASPIKQANRYTLAINDRLALETNEIMASPPPLFKSHRSEKLRIEQKQHEQANEQQHLLAAKNQQQELIETNSIEADRSLHLKPNHMAQEAAFKHEVDDQKATTDCLQVLRSLQKQFVEQVIKQRVADEDHLLLEKWLVDNINDLHRELKQTEMDFEHYVQVTKKMLARNDIERNNYLLKRQLAMQTALPLSIPLPVANEIAFGQNQHHQTHHKHQQQQQQQQQLRLDDRDHNYERRHRDSHLTKLLLAATH